MSFYLMLGNPESMIFVPILRRPEAITLKIDNQPFVLKARIDIENCVDAYQQAMPQGWLLLQAECLSLVELRLLTDDEFRKDVANNSTETLMSVLDDFEVVVTPGRPADSVGDSFKESVVHDNHVTAMPWIDTTS